LFGCITAAAGGGERPLGSGRSMHFGDLTAAGPIRVVASPHLRPLGRWHRL